MTRANTIFIGVRGSVLAIDRSNGETVWTTHLKAGDFVTVVIDNGDLFAATKGRFFRLNPSNGEVLWSNDLPGMGLGIVSVAGASLSPAAAEKRRRDDAASAG